ncbi:hypothetical protein KIN_13680 [Litoreibacter roseus]|uniref:Uncharacterized protein n=1 Tax=Litoreibacter roseus TaxID=2601869 RepID=A0A6N6JDS9_9RHOB|nr:hypothetical protein KIN_13680 [Litoreibacter roseus]
MRHKGHALGNPVLWAERCDILAKKPHRTLAHVQHTKDGFHRRRFARPVWADNYGDLSLIDSYRAVMEDIRP